MGCRKTTCTWALNLQVGPEYRRYTVQLTRDIGCFCEEYRIYVNGQEMKEHGLKYNLCSPLCCAGGQFEWEQDGHAFLLMFNSLSWTKLWGGFGLFVDGVDVNTGREFSAFWRRRGWRVVFVGLVSMLIGIALSLIHHFAVHPPENFFRILGYFVVLAGLSFVVLGLIAVIRYWKPRYPRPQTVEYRSSSAV